MNIVVVGCGKIGTTIIASLTNEGHNITAIDEDAAALAEVTNVYDVMGLCGNGADSDALEEADVGRAELFVAATGSDELNLLACFLAGKMGAAHTIARVRKPEYNDRSLMFMKQHLELAMMVSPDMLAAQEIYRLLKLPSAAKVETFSRNNFEMIELLLKGDSPLVGVPLAELRGQIDAKFLICAVQRGDQVYVPDGSFVLRGGDRIGLTASPAEIQRLARIVGAGQRPVHSVMILGGSRSAFYLSKKLLAAGNDVKIIDLDRSVCETLCDALPKAVVIHGDGAQQELLLEEGLRGMDAFISLTGMDEENILLSFFASTQSVPKVITKINRDEWMSLADRLGLECVVSPRKLIADVVVRYARALQNSIGSNIETLYTLMDDRAEAVEFSVQEDSRLVGIPLRELKLKPNTLIAGIIRDRKPIIPTGDDQVLPGDRVVVLAADRRLRELSDILK